MKHTQTTATADNGFGPPEAAVLLDQSTVRARRQFEPYPPWLLAIRALLALIAYGALWLSTRGQHPYLHPTAAVVPVGIAVGIINVIATLTVAGVVWAAIMAAHANWRAGLSGLAAAATGGVAWFAGPAGAWAFVGVSLSVLLFARAAELSWRQHA